MLRRPHVMTTPSARPALMTSLITLWAPLGCEPLSVQSSGPLSGASLATFDQIESTAGVERAAQGGQRPMTNVQDMASSQGGSAPQSAGQATPLDMSPPPAPDPEDPEDPDRLFDACVEEMDDHLAQAWASSCASYPAAQRVAQGPYGEALVIGACLKLSCEGIDLEGHNGLIAGRSCYDLDLLRQALSAAARDANEEGGCVQPLYSLKVVPLDQRVFGDPCDELTCQIEPDGVFTRGEE